MGYRRSICLRASEHCAVCVSFAPTDGIVVHLLDQGGQFSAFFVSFDGKRHIIVGTMFYTIYHFWLLLVFHILNMVSYIQEPLS